MERMDIEELKDYYKARVEPYGKSMNEILEEFAKETKAYKELEEENKNLKKELEKNNEVSAIDFERVSEILQLKDKIQRLEFDIDARHQLKLLLEGKIEKLEEYNGELIENHKKDIAILCEENKKLKEKLNKAGLEEYGFFNEY